MGTFHYLATVGIWLCVAHFVPTTLHTSLNSTPIFPTQWYTLFASQRKGCREVTGTGGKGKKEDFLKILITKSLCRNWSEALHLCMCICMWVRVCIRLCVCVCVCVKKNVVRPKEKSEIAIRVDQGTYKHDLWKYYHCIWVPFIT